MEAFEYGWWAVNPIAVSDSGNHHMLVVVPSHHPLDERTQFAFLDLKVGIAWFFF